MNPITAAVQRPELLGVKWEETDCPMCGSNQRSPLLHAGQPVAVDLPPKMVVVQCDNCGLCFANPRPTPDTIGLFYPPEYVPHQPRPPRQGRHPAIPGLTRFTSRLRRFQAERMVLKPFGQGRLLDFGCGCGAFLQHMRTQGWQVLGLDFSPTAAAHVEQTLGIPCLQGTLPHPDVKPESLEVVTMWASLEHVHQPLATLRHVHQILVPGGRVIISVPNIAGLPFRWFGTAWFSLDLPRHLTHFSITTLRQMVERAGFEVDGVRMAWHSDWTQASASAARQRQQKPFWLGWFQSRRLASLVGRYCILTQQSDDIVLFAKKPGRT
jgi:SAM-dependent methyltransferase